MNTHQLHIIQQYFSNKPIERAYIFGSHARNQQNEESDIDILVDVESEMSLFEFGRILEDLKELLQIKVDLVAHDGLSKHIRPYIEKEKVLIYER